MLDTEMVVPERSTGILLFRTSDGRTPRGAFYILTEKTPAGWQQMPKQSDIQLVDMAEERTGNDMGSGRRWSVSDQGRGLAAGVYLVVITRQDGYTKQSAGLFQEDKRF